MVLKQCLSFFRMGMKKILWILPNYNFYNIQRLNLLSSDYDILVLAGKNNDKLGFKNNVISKSKVIYASKHKDKFGFSLQVMIKIFSNLKGKDFIYLAVEKKNFFLLILILSYRFFSKSKAKVFSYNHMLLKSGNAKKNKLNRYLTKFFYRRLDKIIFYTKEGCEKAVELQLIKPEKAFWANNTINTIEVVKHYTFDFPPEKYTSILFIGRLIPSKEIAKLVEYYKTLKEKLPFLKMEVIGDGPDKQYIKDLVKVDKDVLWHGAIIKEEIIASIMKRNSAVFIPGLSGLSINHAFAYGRPYITLEADKHGPEIVYLKHNKNGFILRNDFNDNVREMTELLSNKSKLYEFCLSAKEKGEELTVEKWVEQMKSSLEYGN
ncbi:MAG: glycosyltransferase family 4 protein [Flavobacteriaceae bacterium]